jgi:cyanoexosortase A
MLPQSLHPETVPAPSPEPRWFGQTLTGLALALLALHLVLANRVSFDDLRFALLAAVALIALVSAAPSRISPKPGVAGPLAGFAIIAFGLWRVCAQPGALIVAISPIFWGLGLVLILSGGSGIAAYWREGLVVAGLVVTPFVETLSLELAGLDLAPLSARTTAFLLRLCGWDASARDVIVSLPDASIVVSQGCSGLKTAYFLSAFAVILLLVYPVAGFFRKVTILVSAAIVGYMVNAIRVAILSRLAAPGHESSFRFWHIQQGAMIFEILAVAVFLLLVQGLLPRRKKPQPAIEIPAP